MRPYFVLGVFHDDKAGLYRSFYGHAEGRMVSSTSHDLVHWSCAPKEIHVPRADYYERRRDPFVFWIPEMKQYGCVMTTWMKGRSKETGGAVSLATSPDLKEWKDHGAILDPGDIGEPECPQMFRLGERWYLLASIYNRAVGQPSYWISGSPLGPWKKEPAGRLDGKDLCAAQIGFGGETPVLFGWIPSVPSRPGKQSWGGHLALPREVRVLPDGMLGTRLPKKITQVFSRLEWQRITTSPTAVKGSWKTVAAEFNLSLPAGSSEVRMSIAPLGSIILHRDRLRILDTDGACWSELPVQLTADRAMPVSLYVESDIVELFIDERYSLAARLPFKSGPLNLILDTDHTESRVSDVRVAEWKMPR
jgi:sucrose-6-phosphate hydrolase SacC (GH32 family)